MEIGCIWHDSPSEQRQPLTAELFKVCACQIDAPGAVMALKVLESVQNSSGVAAILQ